MNIKIGTKDCGWYKVWDSSVNNVIETGLVSCDDMDCGSLSCYDCILDGDCKILLPDSNVDMEDSVVKKQSALTVQVKVTETEVFKKVLELTKEMLCDERIPADCREYYEQEIKNLSTGGVINE